MTVIRSNSLEMIFEQALGDAIVSQINVIVSSRNDNLLTDWTSNWLSTITELPTK
jgi:hypothetical protein